MDKRALKRGVQIKYYAQVEALVFIVSKKWKTWISLLWENLIGWMDPAEDDLCCSHLLYLVGGGRRFCEPARVKTIIGTSSQLVSGSFNVVSFLS